MTVVEAVRTIKSVGGRVRPMGDFIRCRVPDPAPPLVDQAVEVLRQQKAEALRLLREPAWPAEAYAAQRHFGVPSAKLYPFLNRSVATPDGVGRLLQVFDDRVTVHFKGEVKTRMFRPDEIAIPAD